TALITGAGSGLGYETSKLFLSEGCFVFMSDINPIDTSELEGAGFKGNFKEVRLDVSDKLGWKNALSVIKSSKKNINILVNNAALSNPETRWDLINTSEEIWELAMSVNSTGVFLGMKNIIPSMIKNKHGSVINVSSIFGKVGSEMGAVYHASKGSITTLTKAAAIQYASNNVRINSVHPGFLETNMTKKLHKKPGVRKQRNESTPLGRIGNPIDVAYGILYLASDESSWVTGSELVIDGGYLAQ
ncbi:MAG: SDR family oxidoreductase, partial [Chloroflexota bacterium]|nr:SDR family oxidoreductase [Chloroflexota bacterium]